MKFSILLVLPTLFWTSYSQVPIDTLFHVVAAPGPGSCDTATQRPAVDSWLTDTRTLVDNAVAVMTAFDINNPGVPATSPLLRNLMAWFRVKAQPGQASITTITSTFIALQRFLNRQDQTKNGANTPWLFCGSAWQIETEDLFDAATGLPVMDNSVSPPVRQNIRTYNIPPTLKQTDFGLWDVLTKMQLGPGPDWKYFAYWSSDVRDYLVETKANRYKGNPPSLCNPPPGQVYFAFTEGGLLLDTLTLCPDAFQAVSEPFETIAQCLAAPASTQVGTLLNDVSPRGLTLLHELIHLTLGTDKKITPDSGTKPTKCLGLTSAKALKNPDTYAFFAWSLYLETQGNAHLRWHAGVSQ